MPTLWAHQTYFNNSSTAVTPTLAASGGGYPLWQSSVILPSLFGALQPYWERLIAWCRARGRRRVAGQSGPLSQVTALLNHPAYPFALDAVQRTATTLGFNRPEAWQGLSRHMKSSPGRAENVFRHLEACRLTREACGSTLTNPDCNLLVELAYHEWAARGR